MTATSTNPAAPRIVAAELAAAHDGEAELVITLQFPGAGISQIRLDADAGDRLLRTCRVADIGGLVGHSWEAIAP